jgi:aryl-alcohol dehydrogenase-like predicted oxidoreductase/enamine deaminase RidA (YjgF/YER057c/UK114 family)
MAAVDRTDLAPDLSISRILTGLWQVADMERGGITLDPDETAAAMRPYLDAGFTTFDMADHYGSAEVIAGRFRASLPDPDRVQLLTKWVPEPGSASRQQVRDAVERALDRLGTDRIDLLQYHAWRYSDPTWLDHLGWLDEMRREGLIAHLGLTNFDTEHLALVLHSGIPVASNQVCFSLLDRRPLNGMTALCGEHRVKILAFGTVAGGLLTERWLGVKEPEVTDLETWSQMKYGRFVQTAGGWERFQSLLRALDSVARRLGVSVANVACRWVLEQPSVGGVIIGARLGRSEHIADNRRLLDFELDAAALAELEEALGSLEPIPGDSGDEYRKPPFLTASGDLSHHVASFPPPYPVVRESPTRARAESGTIWEAVAGFSRAVRVGDRILVSGTTATHGNRVVGGDDPGAQATFCLDKIQGAVESLGGRLEDIVRTRIFIRYADEWEPVSRAHGRRFGAVRPANTLVRADLIGDPYRVEMEAEAVISSGDGGIPAPSPSRDEE